jgi:hypothetical protein
LALETIETNIAGLKSVFSAGEPVIVECAGNSAAVVSMTGDNIVIRQESLNKTLSAEELTAQFGVTFYVTTVSDKLIGKEIVPQETIEQVLVAGTETLNIVPPSATNPKVDALSQEKAVLFSNWLMAQRDSATGLFSSYQVIDNSFLTSQNTDLTNFASTYDQATTAMLAAEFSGAEGIEIAKTIFIFYRDKAAKDSNGMPFISYNAKTGKPIEYRVD